MKKIIVAAIFAMAMMASSAFSEQFKVEFEIVTDSGRESGSKVIFASDEEEAADKAAKQAGFYKRNDGSYRRYRGEEFIITDVTRKEYGNSSQEE